MTNHNNITTINVSRDTRNRLADLCKKDDTFDGKINELISEVEQIKK